LGRVDQASLDLVLDAGQKFTFSNLGTSNKVNLLGYYLLGDNEDQFEEDDEDDEEVDPS
jgi:hypothetical protein